MAKEKKPKEAKECTMCEGTVDLIDKARADGVKTAWDRYLDQTPQCKFGQQGICCRNCSMGPCRVRDDKLPGLMVDRSCVHAIDELGTYHNRPGTDEPAKEDDHCPDALRYLYLNLFGRREMRVIVV